MNAHASSSSSATQEREILSVAARFLELSAAGPRGNEVVRALFMRDPNVLVIDSYDSNIRGFDAIDKTYEAEYQAIVSPQVRMYDEGKWKVVHIHYSIPIGVPLREMDRL